MSDKPITDKTITDKTITDKTITDKTITDKTISDKTITDKTINDKTTNLQLRHVFVAIDECMLVYATFTGAGSRRGTRFSSSSAPTAATSAAPTTSSARCGPHRHYGGCAGCITGTGGGQRWWCGRSDEVTLVNFVLDHQLTVVPCLVHEFQHLLQPVDEEVVVVVEVVEVAQVVVLIMITEDEEGRVAQMLGN